MKFPTQTLLVTSFFIVTTLNSFANAEKASPDCPTVFEQLCQLNKYWKHFPVSDPILEKNICFDQHTDLIQVHLQLVEKHLREHPVAQLTPLQKTNRQEGLNVLQQYWKSKQFPINNHHPGQVVPYFIDDFGTACAVGQMVRETGFEAFAERVREENNYAFIEDMQYPELKDWTENFGFEEVELRWVQPTYSNCGTYTDIWVTNANDSGTGSLRWAIEEANNDGGANIIKFNLPNENTPIFISTHLPWLTNPCTIIDGTSQNGQNGYVIIDGSNAVFTTTYWTMVVNADECTVRGLWFRNVGGEFSGAMGAWEKSDITFSQNILTGNNIAIRAGEGAQNINIVNNVIGLSPSQNSAISNIDGINIDNVNYLYIFNNTIAGNIENGIIVQNSQYIDILDNYIGINQSQNQVFPYNDTGMWMGDCSDISIQRNVVVGDDIDSWGIFAKNSTNVNIGFSSTNNGNDVRSNYVGVAKENSDNFNIEQNTLSCNNFPVWFVDQNFLTFPPVITSATTDEIQGTASTNASIDLYIHGDAQCTNAPCQGKTYIGTTQANASGNWTYSGNSIPANAEITALATKNGDTSEYANCAEIANAITCDFVPVITNFNQGKFALTLEWEVDGYTYDFDNSEDSYTIEWREQGSGNWQLGTSEWGSSSVEPVGSDLDIIDCYFGDCPITFDFGPPQTNFYLNGLKPNTTYELRVRLNCPDAVSDYSDIVAVTTQNPINNDYTNENYYSAGRGDFHVVPERIELNETQILAQNCVKDGCVGCTTNFSKLSRGHYDLGNTAFLKDGVNTFDLKIAPDTMVFQAIAFIDTFDLEGYCNIWIDYDADQVFQNSELVYSSTSFHPLNELMATFNVQDFTGERKMRLIYKHGGTPQPYGYYCTGFTYDMNVAILDVFCDDGIDAILCQDWVATTINDYQNNYPNACISIELNSDVCEINIAVDGVKWLEGGTLNIQGDDLGYCKIEGGFETIWSCGQALPDCQPSNCSLTAEEILCLDIMQNGITEYCPQVGLSVYSALYLGEPVYEFTFNNDITVYNFILDCDGELLQECPERLVSEPEVCDPDAGITYNDLTNRETIYTCSDPLPNCNNNCPINPEEILCLGWVQQEIQSSLPTYGTSMTVSTADWNGQELIIISGMNIDSPESSAFDCQGTLIQECGFGIFQFCNPSPPVLDFDNDLSNIVEIWNGTMNIPNCNPPSDCGDSTLANLQFILNPVITTSGSTVQIPVTVENFGDSIQFFFHTLTIDDGMVFQPTAIVDAALNIPNWSVVGDEIEVSWENSTQPALADGTVIFYIEGTIVGDAGTCATVSFTDNLTGDIAVYAITADLMLEEVEAGYTSSNVCAVDATTGLSCATPLNIFCPSITPGSNENGTSNFDLYGCSDYFMNGNESVHRVDIDGPQDVIVTLSGLSADLELIILDECQPENCIAYSFRSNNSSESIIVEDLDGTYYIIVDGYLEASSGYILELDCPDAGDLPSGQLDCSAAINIGCDETVSGETCNGTNNVISYCTGSQSDYESGQEVVYSFTLTEARWLIFTLSDFTEDLDMFLLAGPDCSASDCIFTFNNSGLTEETHQLPLGLGSYYIVVDGFNGAQSSFQLSTSCGTPGGGPVQDFNCDDAAQISCDNSPILGNNDTGSNNVSSHCGTFNTGPELIYEFVLDNENTVEFILSEMTADLNMFIYSDCTVDSECIASSTKNDLSDEGIKLLDMEAGSYFIVIDGYNGAISDFVLTLDCEPMEVMKSGSVYTEYMSAVPDAMMVCSDGMMQIDTVTNEDGDYAFAPVPGGQDYNVTAIRDGNDKDGVNFFDKSLLGLYIQNSPAVVFSNYTKIAADVNGDGCIAQDDALILGDVASASPTSSSEFMNVNSWRFVPASYDLDNAPTNCDNPFITIPKFQVPAFEEAIVLTNLTQDTDGLDFVGVKMGDLNLDWEPGAPQLLAPETVWLNIPSVSFLAGEEKEILLSSADYEEVLAFEMSLKYHQEDLEISNVSGGFGAGTIDFEQYPLNDSDTQKIAHWSWITGDNQSRILANLPYVLKLTIKANKDLENIQNYLWTKPNRADCMAISNDLIAKSVGLNKDFINSATNLEKTGMNLTIFPNPFSETTNLQFTLQQPASFKLNIYNIFGVLVAQKEVQGESGSNLIPIDHRDLPEKGMYYLELINETQSLRATMLFH
jgi:hypothetical protein